MNKPGDTTPMKSSGLVVVGVTAIGVIASLIGALWVGKRQREKMRSGSDSEAARKDGNDEE
ncbi:hypothetical protein DFR30_0910 [Thiogranum longum]|uniref:Uncharacterized protein n=1 Tax=Thiogranum longum TaxID=1537524 RepID=A0A4R1HKC7_9GAMM|nr:hypothetical protein [Thiogranum longum]TCK17672.1 hypothetical protein DFR30_0910 [Thiogranum longum]